MTDAVQTWTASVGGKYLVEIWGADGGNVVGDTTYVGGFGAYCQFELSLAKGQSVVFTVGKGGASVDGKTDAVSSSDWAGSASGIYTSGSCSLSGGGGGATVYMPSFSTAKNPVTNMSYNIYIGAVFAGGGGGAYYTSANRRGARWARRKCV